MLVLELVNRNQIRRCAVDARTWGSMSLAERLVREARLDWAFQSTVQGADLVAAVEAASRSVCKIVDISNMVIDGEVDLAGVSLDLFLRFSNCRFRDTLRLDSAKLRGLVIGGSNLEKGLDLSLCEIDGDLTITNSDISGQLVSRIFPTVFAPRGQADGEAGCQLALRGARVGGDMLIADSRVGELDKPSALAIHGRDMKVVGTLALTDCSIGGETRFPTCTIGGHLVVRGGTFVGQGVRAFRLNGSTFGGSVFCLKSGNTGVTIVGSLHMNGVKVDDLVHLDDVRIGPGVLSAMHEGAASISMRGARVGGAVELTEGSLVGGGMVIDGSEFGDRFECRAELGGGTQRMALSANGFSSVGSFVLAPKQPVQGSISIQRSVIGSDLDLSGLVLAGNDPQEEINIDLTGTRVQGSILARRLAASGSCRLTGASVQRDVDLRGAVLGGGEIHALRTTGEVGQEPRATASGGTDDPAEERWALFADALSVGGTVDLQHAAFDAGIWLRGAKLGGRLDLADSKIKNQGKTALSLSLAQIDGTLRADGLVAEGLVEMNRAHIAGRVTFSGASLLWRGEWKANRRGSALEVISAFVGGGMLLDWKSAEPFVDLIDSRTPVLIDAIGRWPEGGMDWAGFRYGRFGTPASSSANAWASQERIQQLGKQRPLDLGVYQYAAGLFRSHGYPRGADDIIIAGRRAARPNLQLGGRFGCVGRRLALAWDFVFEKTVKYGLRPSRALFGMIVLIAAMWVTVAVSYPARDASVRATSQNAVVYGPVGRVGGSEIGDGEVAAAEGCEDGRVRCFTPYLFAIDTVVPILDLGQAQTWYVNPSGPWAWILQLWVGAASILGWVLSTLFALSFTRLGERGR